MVKYTWKKENVPSYLKVRQVYAVAFNNMGNIILQIDRGKYKLTGGKPEDTDRDYEDTVKREYLEEINVELESVTYLGYLLVEEEQEKYAQVRMIAKIKEIGIPKEDIATKRTYQRFMSNTTNVKKYLNYEEAGNALLDDAIKLAKEKYSLKFTEKEYLID